MTVPANLLYVNGAVSVTADNLNTFVQTCDSAVQLRLFVGTSKQTVQLTGISYPNDGFGGVFYWNTGSTAPDDNLTTIVPPSAASGAWTRALSYYTIVGGVNKPIVTGSKGANAALTSLMTALASIGVVIDTTS